MEGIITQQEFADSLTSIEDLFRRKAHRLSERLLAL